MNVSLTPQLEEFVRRKVATGLYNSASEVVRAALRLLIEHESAADRLSPAAAPDKDAVRAALADLEGPLRQKGIATAALFGSVVRGEAGPESDIDILIDVRPGARFSLFDLIEVKEMLEEKLGHGVDIVTRKGLNPGLRDRVLREAEPVFT